WPLARERLLDPFARAVVLRGGDVQRCSGAARRSTHGAPATPQARAGATSASAAELSRRNRARAPVLERGDERPGADGQRSGVVVDHVEVPMDVEAAQAGAPQPARLDPPPPRAHG